jgi:hypothetical protein
MDVLLAGTTPSAQVATAAAGHIKQVRDQGMVGLAILPLILKTDPNTHRALQTAWGSIKAEASGPRLTLSASIPKEAVAAAADAVDAAVVFVKGLLGQK